MERAADLLHASFFDLYRLAETHGMEPGASDEQRRLSRELRPGSARKHSRQLESGPGETGVTTQSQAHR